MKACFWFVLFFPITATMTCYWQHHWIINDTCLDLEHLAGEQGNRFRKQRCCHSLDLPEGIKTERQTDKNRRKIQHSLCCPNTFNKATCIILLLTTDHYNYSYLSISSCVARTEWVAGVVSGNVFLWGFFHLTCPGSLHAVGRHQHPTVPQWVVTQVLVF